MKEWLNKPIQKKTIHCVGFPSVYRFLCCVEIPEMSSCRPHTAKVKKIRGFLIREAVVRNSRVFERRSIF